MGEGSQGETNVLDHSLGGMEGYLLIDRVAALGRVCIYVRAGYGWSNHSPRPRTSQDIANEKCACLPIDYPGSGQ